MMIKHKIKKTLILLLIFIPSFTFLGGPKYDGGNGGGGDSYSDFDWGDPSKTPTYGSSCDAVRCSYSYSYNKSTDYYVEMKDVYGNVTIIENGILNSNMSNNFLAGTYVMLKVYQKQNFYSQASYRVAAKRQVWTCDYYKYEKVDSYCIKGELPGGGCIGGDANRQDLYDWVKRDTKKDQDCSCPDLGDYKVEPKFQGWRDITSQYAKSCSSGATPKKIDVGSLFVAEYRDSNDIDNTTVTQVAGHKCTTKKGTLDKTTNRDGEESGGNTLSGECNVSYDRETTICINVKTGKVKYQDGTTDGQCNQDEYKVTTDKDGYWKYFIPLNANSANDFSFSLKSSGYAEDAQMCQAYKDAYPNNWQNTIKMNSNGTCSFKLTITIPVVQKFYNELSDGKTFKGFNFYYKPIDIDNPFPNGLTDTSLWYDWLQDKNNELDLSESYDEVTYYANTSGSEETIRNYTDANSYTSWNNMNKNGTSNFVSNEGIVIRNVRTDSFYKLGCGPWNVNEKNEDGSKNVFYQPECDSK